MDWNTVAIFLGFAGTYGSIVWAASKIASKQEAHTEKLGELANDLSEHVNQDREFQLQVVERLGSLSTTLPPQQPRRH